MVPLSVLRTGIRLVTDSGRLRPSGSMVRRAVGWLGLAAGVGATIAALPDRPPAPQPARIVVAVNPNSPSLLFRPNGGPWVAWVTDVKLSRDPAGWTSVIYVARAGARVHPERALPLLYPLRPPLSIRDEGDAWWQQPVSFAVASGPEQTLWLADARDQSWPLSNVRAGRDVWVGEVVVTVRKWPPEGSRTWTYPKQPLPGTALGRQEHGVFLGTTRGAGHIGLAINPQGLPWLICDTRLQPRHLFVIRSTETEWLEPKIIAGGSWPSAAHDGGGRYHVFYERGTSICQIMSKDGETWSHPAAVPNTKGGRQPAARFGAGNLWLVWSVGPEKSADLYLATSNDDGATWSKPRRLTSGKAADFEPSILVDKDNTVWVAFVRRDGQKKELWSLHFPAGQQ